MQKRNKRLFLTMSIARACRAVVAGVVIASGLLSGCSSGDSGGGVANLLNLGSELQKFFVEPVKDSIIAAGDGSDVMAAGTLSAQNAHMTRGVVSAAFTDDDRKTFDLTKNELSSCKNYEESDSKRFSMFGGIQALSNYFAWNADPDIPLSYPGEFSYVSSFAYSCDVDDVLAAQNLDIDSIKSESKTVTIADEVGDYAKATVSIDNELLGGEDLQVMSLTRSTVKSVQDIESLLAAWPNDASGDNGLQSFSRVFQGVSLEKDQTNDQRLRMSVAHGIYFESAVENLGQYDLSADDDSSADSPSPVVMKQKFTLVVSDSDRTWQGLAFFSSYKIHDQCLPRKIEGGGSDYERYQLTKSKASDDLVCDGDAEEGEPEIIYRELPTDSALFIAVVDKTHGSYTSRFVCNGGHKVTVDGNYDISGCAIDEDAQLETTYYDSKGALITDETEIAQMMTDSLGMGSRVRLIRSQMHDYSNLGQFPATVASLGSLVGDFDKDETITHAAIESKQYASEQHTVDLPAPETVDVTFDTVKIAIDVSWPYPESEVPITYYEVYRSGDDNSLGSAVKIGTVDADPSADRGIYTDDNFVANVRYYYWLRPCSDEGCSIRYSGAVSLSVTAEQIGSPTAPQSVTLNPSDPKITRKSYIHIVWEDSGDAPYYLVYRGPSETELTRIARRHSKSYTDHGLLEFGQGYKYWVEACSKGVCSDPIASDDAVIEWPTPEGLVAMPFTGDPRKHRIGWNPVRFAKIYELYVRVGSGTSFIYKKTSMLIEEHGGLAYGTTYYYSVKACGDQTDDVNNCSVASDEVSVTTPPEKVSISEVEVIDRSGDITTISKHWTETFGTLNYKVTAVCGDTTTTTTTVASDSDKIEISGLPLNTDCRVSVQACNDGGCSDPSTSLTIKTPVLASPRLAVTSFALLAHFQWESVDGAAKYKPWWKSSLGDETRTYLEALDTAGTFVYEGIATGGTYEFGVEACDRNDACSLPSIVTLELFSLPLNDTGIDKYAYYDDLNNPLFDASCDQNSAQDCALGRDASQLTKFGTGSGGFDFSRINSDGSDYTGDGTFATASWECVRDNHTGLLWQVFDSYDQTPISSWQQWQQAIDNSGSGSLCRNSVADWRLPTIQELLSIVRLGSDGGTLDPTYFPNDYDSTVTRETWTASDYTSDNTNDSSAWVVSNAGIDIYRPQSKSESAVVRLVKSAKPANTTNNWEDDRYKDATSDSVIEDKYTGLMWAVCPLGININLQAFEGERVCAIEDSSAKMSWNDAIDAAEEANVFGYTDWRLPNVKELQSILAYDRHDPATNKNKILRLFNSTGTDRVIWSSSPVGDISGDEHRAFTIDFADGKIEYPVITSKHYVRIVRTTDRALGVVAPD